ncbi:MAG: SAM-dependent methyltransferase, partial [Mycobacteriales bacterium]
MSRKTTGRITFVGAGPGDPGLLTVRAAEVLRSASLVLVDPDVPPAVCELAGSGAPGTPGTPASPASPVELRPAIGDPATVAGTLVAAARSGSAVVRLVAGDPLSADAVVAEAVCVATAGVPFDVVPGVPAATAVPAYAGVPV